MKPTKPRLPALVEFVLRQAEAQVRVYSQGAALTIQAVRRGLADNKIGPKRGAALIAEIDGALSAGLAQKTGIAGWTSSLVPAAIRAARGEQSEEDVVLLSGFALTLGVRGMGSEVEPARMYASLLQRGSLIQQGRWPQAVEELARLDLDSLYPFELRRAVREIIAGLPYQTYMVRDASKKTGQEARADLIMALLRAQKVQFRRVDGEKVHTLGVNALYQVVEFILRDPAWEDPKTGGALAEKAEGLLRYNEPSPVITLPDGDQIRIVKVAG